MRDKRFVAVHRNGLLTKEQHKSVMKWARKCSEHILAFIDENIEVRLLLALSTAKEWEEGRITINDARKASKNAHAVARISSDPVVKATARSIGHAVATAHMADHALVAALYALRAFKYSGRSVEAERQWQLSQLPSEIKEHVFIAMKDKGRYFKM